MTSSVLTMLMGLLAAGLAGAAIGAERTLHGREGFRTHALVAVAAAAAVIVGGKDLAAASRLAQGVMTGIGFVGAGVVFKEGVSVQGLTTAASMWATAAIGLLLGQGAYWAGGLTTGLVLVVLIVLRWLETAAPNRVQAWARFCFEADKAPDLTELRLKLAQRGAEIRELSYYRTSHPAPRLEFKGVLSASGARAFDDLAQALRGVDGLAEFELSRVNK
ncbi:MAG: MgtC/SapB family protein [Proteobacteria bacterium]|nr:MgtC/SapB family protein [Pseudomonadota bacterium]